MGDNNSSAAVDAAPSITKSDAGQEATPSSLESTPDRDTEIVQDQAQPQKRKGGRKPIYATSEERKQRNRQAQAAFRERRTEYIKQLETTIKHHEETLQTLQQSHRSAADECLMLRYKNSLLERILLEKGIDVQAELQMKTGSPALGPTYMPPHPAPSSMVSAPLQRTALNRQYARRSGQPFGQRIAPGSATQSEMSFSARSPQGHPTPSSHASSPTGFSNQSPAALPQGGMTPPAAAMQGQHHQYTAQQPVRSRYSMQHHPQRMGAPTQYSGSGSVGGLSGSNLAEGANTSAAPSAYYPSPFQKHIDQLGKFLPSPVDSVSTEQEYDSQPITMLENEADTADQPMQQAAEPGQFQAPQYQQQSQQHGLPHSQQHAAPKHDQAKNGIQDAKMGAQGDSAGQVPGLNQMFDTYNDPMMDADPFGLSASMHFPTSYSFDQAQQR